MRAYLVDHARGNTTAFDLVAALAAHAAVPDLQRALGTFVDQYGAPVVTAAIDCAGPRPTIVIGQRPLTTYSRARWRVPVCVVAGDQVRHERACGVSDGGPLRLELASCPTWVWPNADGVGYYRSELPTAVWAALAADGWAHLSPAERLVMPESLPSDPATIVTWLPRLAAETTAPATAVAAKALRSMARQLDGATRARLYARVEPLFGARARALGWRRRPSDTSDDEEARTSLVTLLAWLGDASLGHDAVTLAASWRLLPADEREPILRAAVRADPAVFDRMLVEVRSEKSGNTRRDLASALGAVHDPTRLLSALDELKGYGPPRDLYPTLRSASAEAALPAVVEQFVVDHLELYARSVPAVLTALTASCDASRVDRLRDLALKDRADNAALTRKIEAAFVRMARCADERPRTIAAVARWLGAGP